MVETKSFRNIKRLGFGERIEFKLFQLVTFLDIFTTFIFSYCALFQLFIAKTDLNTAIGSLCFMLNGTARNRHVLTVMFEN